MRSETESVSDASQKRRVRIRRFCEASLTDTNNPLTCFFPSAQREAGLCADWGCSCPSRGLRRNPAPSSRAKAIRGQTSVLSWFIRHEKTSGPVVKIRLALNVEHSKFRRSNKPRLRLGAARAAAAGAWGSAAASGSSLGGFGVAAATTDEARAKEHGNEEQRNQLLHGVTVLSCLFKRLLRSP
jgi:hypothetical protein